MATPYLIILSDSEDEYENVPMNIPEPDSNNESSSSDEPMEEDETPASENIVAENQEPSQEEDPSEDDPSEHPLVESASEPLSPPPLTYVLNTVLGDYIPTPQRQTTSPSETSIPSTDPYLDPNSNYPYLTPNANTHRRANARRWTWLPETLQTWREEEEFPLITEEGETSSSRDFPFTREPPHHTVPLLVVRLATQELRIDHLEDAVDGMPGNDLYENLQGEVQSQEHRVENMHDRVEGLEEQLVEVAEAVQELASREVQHIRTIQRLVDQMAQKDRDMIRMQSQIDHLTALATASFERDAMIMRGGHHF